MHYKMSIRVGVLDNFVRTLTIDRPQKCDAKRCHSTSEPGFARGTYKLKEKKGKKYFVIQLKLILQFRSKRTFVRQMRQSLSVGETD